MKILNFGSINIDITYTVDEFVRAGETIFASSVSRHVGGKGCNQSIALARAGASVYHAGCIGSDGSFLLDELKASGVNTGYISKINEPTGTALVQVNKHGNNCILLYGGANRCISKEFVDQVLSGFTAGDVLLLQNEINLVQYISEKAWEKGIHIVANPSPADAQYLPVLAKSEWILLNEVEASFYSGADTPSEYLPALHERFPTAKIVITFGENGSVCFDGKNRINQSAYHVNTVDTTGAGDTFTGFFLAGILRGESAQEALKIASKASAMSVTRSGASESMPTLEEVIAFQI